MNFIIQILIVFTSCSFLSCQNNSAIKPISEGEIINDLYWNEDLNWKMKIPDNWNKNDNTQNKSVEKEMLNEIEKTANRKFDVSKAVNLIDLTKDEFNSFQSTAEPNLLESENDIVENNLVVKNTLYKTYQNINISVDSTKTEKIKIDGVNFETYKFIIYDDLGKTLMVQEIFCGIVKGTYLMVNINSNNDIDKNIIKNSWLNSTFR